MERNMTRQQARSAFRGLARAENTTRQMDATTGDQLIPLALSVMRGKYTARGSIFRSTKILAGRASCQTDFPAELSNVLAHVFGFRAEHTTLSAFSRRRMNRSTSGVGRISHSWQPLIRARNSFFSLIRSEGKLIQSTFQLCPI